MSNITKVSSILLLAFLFFLTSCGNSNASNVLDGPEYTSAYICPMHCEGSGSPKAGTCPTCKMDYVANTEKTAPDSHEGHNHNSHEGHNHNSHEGHNHDSHEGHNHDSHEGHDHSGHSH